MSATASPLLMPTDTILLVDDFIVQTTKRRLIDTSLGVFHSCSPEALLLLDALKQGLTLSRLQTRALEQCVTMADLWLFLDFLNTCGALRYSRSVRQYPWAWRTNITHWMHGVRHSAITWRSPLSLWNITKATLRACRSLWIATIALDMLLSVAWKWQFLSVCTWSGAALALFVFSIVIHEYAHASVIRFWGHPLMVIQQGPHVGLLHARLSRGIETTSACIGPLCGGAFCFIMGVLFHYVGAYGFAALSLCIGFLHIGSFLPWYGDGRSLWMAYKNSSGGA